MSFAEWEEFLLMFCIIATTVVGFLAFAMMIMHVISLLLSVVGGVPCAPAPIGG